MWEVNLVEEVNNWFLELAESDPDAADRVEAAIGQLETEGPALSRPTADSIKGSKIHNLKELRPGDIRILFVFDPARQAILLVAGNKRGNWKGWYEENIPVAEDRYAAWLSDQGLEE